MTLVYQNNSRYGSMMELVKDFKLIKRIKKEFRVELEERVGEDYKDDIDGNIEDENMFEDFLNDFRDDIIDVFEHNMLKRLCPNDYADKVIMLTVDDDTHNLTVYRLDANKEEALDFMVKSIKEHGITSEDLFEKLV